MPAEKRDRRTNPRLTGRKPTAFILCFESHRARAGVWAVQLPKVRGRSRANWLHADEVSVLVPVRTVYRGATGPQPRAYLTGTGVVTRYGRYLVITA